MIGVECARCTGHCCRSFHLPWSPAELEVAADQARRFRLAPDGEARSAIAAEGPMLADVEQIAAMVEHLGEHQRNPVLETKLMFADGHSGHFYSCLNLLENGDCGIYADRPAMCRGYPYGNVCEFVDCTMRSVPADRGEG